MAKIVLTKGLPCSGKTTWAKECVVKRGYLRVSMDDIRESVFGGWSEKKEKACLRLRDVMVRFAIAEGKNVVVDATNLNPKHEKRLRALAEELGADFEVNDSFLAKSPMACVNDDIHRGAGAVGAKVIWEMYRQWVRPNVNKRLDNSDKKRCILCDLDGTLAEKTTDRKYGDMTRVGEDSVNALVACLTDCLGEASDYLDLLLVTGRSEAGREGTEDWLDRNGIVYQKLFMRADGDERSNAEVKREIVLRDIEPQYEVLGAIEDSLSCAEMYYNLGIDVIRVGDSALNI